MTPRWPVPAASLSLCALLASIGCGSGASLSSAGASADGGGGPGQDSAASNDAASGQDGTSGPDGASAQDSAAEAAPGDAASDGAEGGACSVTSSSSLPGVSIVFRAPVTCTFTLAQTQAGIMIPYDVVVAADVANVVSAPQDAGGCGAPGQSGLILFEQLGGGGQSYCVCDTGLCAPGSRPPVTVHAGTYGGSFSWTGRNWGGPSDTGNPMGAVFPAGSYALTVSARGIQGAASFAVTTTLTIQLTP